jgi:hypothetical protein
MGSDVGVRYGGLPRSILAVADYSSDCLGGFAELDKNPLFCAEEDIELLSPLEFLPDAVPVPQVFRPGAFEGRLA